MANKKVENGYYPWSNKIISAINVINNLLKDTYCIIGGIAVGIHLLQKENKSVLKDKLRSTKDIDCIFNGNNLELIDKLGDYAKHYFLERKEI